MKLINCIFWQICFVGAINAKIPNFINGRPKHGFLKSFYSDFPRSLLPEDRWVEQKLDHFKASDLRTWKQRYSVNDTFYEPGGPVFLMIGGEGAADPIWMVEGQWIKYAQYYKAFCVQLEHRFYGKSHPTSDLSVASLAYLSSEQALADLAYFRNYATEKYILVSSKWIAFGGSYPGSLAAWFRLKYPHLVSGAVSTSAPLVAVIDFKDFLGVVRDALKTTHTQCIPHIQNATQQLEKILQTVAGQQKVKQMFRLCDAIDVQNQNDVSNLYSLLAGNFEGVVQYNKDNRAFEGVPGTDVTIDTLCSIMASPHTSALQNYALVNSIMLNTYQQKCLDFSYKEMIEDLKAVEWTSEAGDGGRQWTYQTCTEFGYYQSSDLDNQPFGHHFPLKFSTQQCMDIFGPQFNETFLEGVVKWTNTNYGGRKLKVKRIVFVNGSIDPWHALGITSDLGPEATAIFINGTAHCANMYPESSDDLPQLKQAREQIKILIGQWIK